MAKTMGAGSEPGLRAEFGRRLTQVRLRRGHTNQTAFAELIGVGITRYNNWEKGGAFPNSLEPLKKLCEVLGVTADYLLFGETGGLSAAAYEALVPDRESRAPSP